MNGSQYGNDSNTTVGNSTHQNATLDYPIELDVIQTVAHVTYISIGSPLNLFICHVIISYRRLHKPRNILWLGFTFANFFTLLTISTELIAYYSHIPAACEAFVAVTGIAYTSLLANTLLALIDRYIATSYPLWHRKKVTIKKVISAQVLLLLVLSAMIKSPFLIGVDTLSCAKYENQYQSKILAVSNFLLVAACVAAQILVFMKTKNYLSRNTVEGGTYSTKNTSSLIASKSSSNKSQQQESNVDDINGTVAQVNNLVNMQSVEFFMNFLRRYRSWLLILLMPAVAQSTAGVNNLQMHVGDASITKLELEATWSLLTGVTSLLIFTCPVLLIGLVNWSCRQVYAQQCPRFDAMVPYAREILIAHVVYNPIIYMYRSREFSATARQKFWHRRIVWKHN